MSDNGDEMDPVAFGVDCDERKRSRLSRTREKERIWSARIRTGACA
jgi:hypothetical protein